MAAPLPSEIIQQTRQAVNAAGGNKAEAARQLGIPISTLKSRLEMAAGMRIKGTSTLYDVETGEAKLQWVKTTEDQAQQDAKLRAIIDGLKGELPVFKRAYRPSGKRPEHLLNMIPMGDPHFGLLCWDKEVGEDFDLAIAKQDFCGATDYLVSQAPPAKRCLIVNLGDFYHVDNMDNQTPAHRHSLDVDSRLPKIIEVGVVAFRQAITTALSRHDVVEVVCCRANHDPVLGLALAILLKHVYEKEPRVIIHAQPTFRHYVRHGKTLLAFCHGHQTKDAQLPGIMATERAKDWGETLFRYFWRGHHHQDAKQEYNGCIVEQVRTLAARDAYASGAGYLSGRDMKLITYHSEYGEQGRSTCGIDLLRSLQ
jgi:hypothetical protein